MLGLLHVGFNVSLETSAYGEEQHSDIDRLAFYFNVADGWADDFLLCVPGEDNRREYEMGRDKNGNVMRKSESELRQQVARNAFDMLCTNLFTWELHESNREFGWKWVTTITSDALFPIIQNFFRAEEGRFGDIGIRNFSLYHKERSHNEKQAVSFLLNLVRFLWVWKEQEIWSGNPDRAELEKQQRETRSRLNEAKPWMVEILSELGELRLLREWMLELDKPCLKKLKDVALRGRLREHSHPVKADRKVATIDEACFTGSAAARFLKEHELKKREHERLSAIREAEREREKADQKIKKLSSKG